MIPETPCDLCTLTKCGDCELSDQELEDRYDDLCDDIAFRLDL